MRDDGLIILGNDESFWGLERVLIVKTGKSFFRKFWEFEVVELSWVTYQDKIEKKFFVFFVLWGGLIIMDDLSRWKMQIFFKVVLL